MAESPLYDAAKTERKQGSSAAGIGTRRSRHTGTFVAIGLSLAIAGAAAGDSPMDANGAEAQGGLRFDELRMDYSGLPALSRYPTRDGTTLPVRHYPTVAETDRVLILLHGSGYHSRYLLALAAPIAASGVARVYTPDLRGHGESPDRRGDIDYPDQLEDDVADLVAFARREHPGARVFVGGHSSGGGLATRYAGSQYGGASAGYVLLAPFLRHDAPTTRENAGGWARPKIARIIALSILNGFGVTRFDDTVVIEFEMPEAFRDGTETLSYTQRMNVGFAPRAYERDLAAIDAPLLVLVGADDEAFVAEQFAPAILPHAPEARVEIVPGASHMGIVVGPGAASRIIEWLAAS